MSYGYILGDAVQVSMTKDREQELATMVQSLRALLTEVTPEGLKSWVVIEEYSQREHPSRFKMYLQGVNRFWEEAYEAGVHARVAKEWSKSYGHQTGADPDEAYLQAAEFLRDACIHFKPKGVRFMTYAKVLIFRKLRHYFNQQASPVGAPEKVLRDGPIEGISLGDDLVDLEGRPKDG